jgi:hypothetical protein
VTVSKESDIERSCPVSIKVVCAFRHGGRRGEATKTRKSGFRIIIAETRGGMCYRHNLAGPEGGPRARWAQRINVINLRIGSCVGVYRAELAM